MAKPKKEFVKRAKFVRNWFESGALKFAAGADYPITEETTRLIASGDAEEVEVEMQAEVAAETAEKTETGSDDKTETKSDDKKDDGK
jgi:hypothetical protein